MRHIVAKSRACPRPASAAFSAATADANKASGKKSHIKTFTIYRYNPDLRGAPVGGSPRMQPYEVNLKECGCVLLSRAG